MSIDSYSVNLDPGPPGSQHMPAMRAGARCDLCPLRNASLGPVPPTLPDHIDVLVIAEAPGHTEVSEGQTLIGASGREVRQALRSANVPMDRVGYTNAILCMPVGGDLKRYLRISKKHGQPSPIECCKPRLQNDVRRAKFVLLMGGASLTAVDIKHSVMGVRGMPLQIPGGPPALATPHAAYVMRDEGARYRPVFHADVAKAARLAYQGSTWRDPWYFVPKTAAEVHNFLSRHQQRTAVDVETDGIDRFTCKLRRIGIGTDKEVLIYSPLSVRGHAMLPDHEIQAQSRVIADYFRWAARTDTHNGMAFDSVILHRYGMPLDDAKNFDSMIGHQIGPTSELPHRLDFLASMYTDSPAWKQDTKHSNVQSDEALDKYLSYDIANTYVGTSYVEQNIVWANQQHVYQIDSELYRIGRAMSALGLYIDPVKRMEFAQEYQVKSDRLRAEFAVVAGAEVNPASPVQVRKLLYDVLGLPVLEEHITNSEEPSTDENTLLDLLALGVDERASKVIHGLIGFREAEKILSVNTGHLVDGRIEGGPPVHSDGRVRTTWRPGKVTGRWGSSDPINCFSGDTEILTTSGWVRFDQLERGVKVAQWDNGEITFVVPTAYIEKDAETIGIKLRAVDLRVTPEHRCLFRHKENGELRVIEAKDYPRQMWRQVHAGRFVGGDLDLGDAFLRLVVAAQADGQYGYGDRLCFGFKKQRKIKRLIDLLRQLGVTYKTWNKPDGGIAFEIRGDIAIKCREVLGPNKSFGPWVLRLTRKQMDIFCEEIYHWDGSWTRKNNYSSSVEVNVDYVQAVLVLSGFRARKRTYRNSTPTGLNYQVDVVDRDWSLCSNRKLSNHRVERVYCVSVPSSFVVVRRNGCVVISGQCQNIPKKLRAMFVPASGNVYVAADMQAVELRKIAELARDENYIRAFAAFDNKTGPDVHVSNACGLFRCTPDKVDDHVRRFAKNFCYALSYGAEPPKIYQTLSLLRDDNLKPMFPTITLPEIERIYNLYWQLHPAIPEWRKKITFLWRARRYLETQYHHRKRYFLAGESPTEFPSFMVQGSCADMQNDAIMAVPRAYPFDYVNHRGLVVNGHDQIVIECAEKEAEDVKVLLRRVMEKRSNDLYYPAEPKVARDWKTVS